MKALFVLYHDDPPCNEKLRGGFCVSCGFTPDMQSLEGRYFCPSCNVEVESYKTMVCPSCKQTLEKP